MDRTLLKEVILDQQAVPKVPLQIERDIDLKSAIDSSLIAVITGIRRCGKSTLLQAIRKKSKESSYYINFDDDRLVLFTVEDFQVLLELFIELFEEQHTFFFDEIQNIPGWERFVRRLHDQGNKIYITGSNATLFSQELGTRLTGRYIQIELYPFSFYEYLTSYNQLSLAKTHLKTPEKATLNRYFNQFQREGGFPLYIQEKQNDFLHFLYEGILYRDIITRHKIAYVTHIRECVYFLASNVGKEITFNSLRKQLGVASPSTISDYCNYLENSYLCFFINRFDYSLKKQIHYAKKVYFIDSALAKAVGFRMDEEKGRMLENIVFIELKRRKKEIYFHQTNKECDFILKEGTRITTAIQVCVSLESAQTQQREIEGLLDALQTYKLTEGFILTENTERTEKLTVNRKKLTIHILPVAKFLLNRG